MTKTSLLPTTAVILLAITAHVAGERNPGLITKEYAVGRRGYEGAIGKWLIKKNPDYGANREDRDLMIGQHANPDRDVFRSLIKFTNLDIPAESEIVSANFSFRADLGGAPRIAIYGLLKDWTSSTTWSTALAGETTWNSQHHLESRWGLPGADKSSSEERYDGDADRLSTPDSVFHCTTIQRVKLDVTRSLASQFAHGRLYGWLLTETTGRADTYVNSRISSARLEVTYRPPPGALATAPPTTKPHLITFYLAPTKQIVQNLDRLNELPFEGSVFHGARNDRAKDWQGDIINSVFGPEKLALENYSEFIEDVQTIQSPPSKFVHNFLRVNTCVPGTLIERDIPYTWETRPRSNDDVTMWWVDEFDTVIHNMKVAAETARQAGMKGIFLEGEEYGGNIWTYANQLDARERGKTYAESCAQVRYRAFQLAQAINEAYPDMTMIVYFHIYREPAGLLKSQSFWNHFMDGLVEGVDQRMRLVTANSMSYGFDGLEQFQEEYEWAYKRAPQISLVPEKYLRQVDVGFGLWFNCHGWGRDPEFYSSSASWQSRVEKALSIADSYVWVFTGGGGKMLPDWWSGGNIPQPYVDATLNAVDLMRRRWAGQ